MWKRGCGDFYKVDDQDNEISQDPNDVCTFVTGPGCPKAFKKCVKEGDCQTFLGFQFDASATNAADMVKKINPNDAYRLLSRFGFGSYLADPEPGKMRFYKVQSVESWIRDLNDICTDECSPLKRMVKKRVRTELNNILSSPRAPHFKLYLEVLVDWVNSNTTVLNPNEYEVPKPALNTGRMAIYQFQQPPGQQIKIHQDYCDMNRLQAAITGNIVHGMTGGGTDNLEPLLDRIIDYASEEDEKRARQQLDVIKNASNFMVQQEISTFLDIIKEILGKKMMQLDG